MYFSSPPCDGVRRVLLILAIEDEEYNTYYIARLRTSSGLLILSSSPPRNIAHNILLALYLVIRPHTQSQG